MEFIRQVVQLDSWFGRDQGTIDGLTEAGAPANDTVAEPDSPSLTRTVTGKPAIKFACSFRKIAEIDCYHWGLSPLLSSRSLVRIQQGASPKP